MDKAQKQLIDTYFRKRNIAVKGQSSDYDSYETVYLMDNNMIDVKDLKGVNIASLLIYRPGLYNRLKPYLGKLSGNDIADVLVWKPEFVRFLNINKVKSELFSYIFEHQPQLINYFDLNKLKVQTHPDDSNEYFDVINIITKLPEENFNKIDINRLPQHMVSRIMTDKIVNNPNPKIQDYDWNLIYENGIVEILGAHPEFFDEFKSMGLLDKFDSMSIIRLFGRNPELVKKFDLNKFDFGDEDGMRMKHIYRNYPELATMIKQQKM